MTQLTPEQLAEIVARDAACDVDERGIVWHAHPADLAKDRRALLSHVSALTAEIAALRRDAERYAVLRNSVLQGPLAAGFVMITTAADIDAQCDQILAMSGGAK